MMMVTLVYIIKYSYFIHSLYKLHLSNLKNLFDNENDKCIKYVNKCAISCGPLAIKLLQLILMSGYYKIKNKKLNFVLEDCNIHPFEETYKMYLKDFGCSIFDDFEFHKINEDNVIGSGSIGQVYKA